MPRDCDVVGCGWIVVRGPERCCTNPAVVRIRSKLREIVACDWHRRQATAWARHGGEVTVTVLDEPSTLF